MRKLLFTIIFLSLVNNVFSQKDSINLLVRNAEELKLNMLELVDYANKNCKKDTDKARFFHQWIGSNIKYDLRLLKKLERGRLDNKKFWKTQDEHIVFKKKKGVCAGYSKLFQWFMKEVNIESVIISGYIRDKRNHYVELSTDDNFRHAWNGIKLNGKWILVDTTWGTSLDVSISDFYFDIKPELAIITHYPEDNKWQLLEKPLSLKEFNNSKFIAPIWFFVGFKDIPKLKSDKQYYYFITQKNTENWEINLLYSTNNKDFIEIKNIKRIDQDGYTFMKFYKKEFPGKGFFKVNITKDTGATYLDVINFKI